MKIGWLDSGEATRTLAEIDRAHASVEKAANPPGATLKGKMQASKARTALKSIQQHLGNAFYELSLLMVNEIEEQRRAGSEPVAPLPPEDPEEPGKPEKPKRREREDD